MYKSFYFICPVSWMFCGKQNSDKLEKLQERALRFVFFWLYDLYSDLLKRGNFLSLSALRIKYLAIEMYKCVHGLNPPDLNELFVSKDTRYDLRDSKRLQQHEFQTVRYGFKSFRFYGSKLWNSLPADVKHSENVYHFKKNITQWCRAYRVNVMGLLYNDRHDILPPIWNLSHYFIGFICVLVFIYNSHIPVHISFSCYQWSNRSLSSILSLNRCLHFSTRMFYRTIVLYMLDS